MATFGIVFIVQLSGNLTANNYALVVPAVFEAIVGKLFVYNSYV